MSIAAKAGTRSLSDAEVVEAYLTASMIPDPDAAAAYMKPGTVITFTGGREVDHPRRPTRFNARRYRWVKKRMDRFHVCPGTDDDVVYHERPTASSFGAIGMPLESWILRSALGTPVDPYLTAASALARSARGGCASMMVHYTRPSGSMPLVEEAKAIARAASDVGIRIAFALAVRDQNPVVYGDEEPVLSGLSKDDLSTIEQMFVRAPMSPKAYIELTDAIAAAIAGPQVDVQLGPAGVQWCSKPLLEAVAEQYPQTCRLNPMHLPETIYQHARADPHFSGGNPCYLR